MFYRNSTINLDILFELSDNLLHRLGFGGRDFAEFGNAVHVFAVGDDLTRNLVLPSPRISNVAI